MPPTRRRCVVALACGRPQVLEQYDRLAAAVAAGERWQWHLPLGFWQYNAALAAHIAARGEAPPRSLADPHHPEERGPANQAGACSYGRVGSGGGVAEGVRGLLRAVDASEETAGELVALHVRRGDSADGSLNYWCNSQVTHSGPTLSTVAQPRAIQRLHAPGVGLAQLPSLTGAHVAHLDACTSPVGLTPSRQWRAVEDSPPTVCAQVGGVKAALKQDTMVKVPSL